MTGHCPDLAGDGTCSQPAVECCHDAQVVSGDSITRAAETLAAHLTAVYGYSEVDPMRVACMLAEAGLLRTEADWEDERYQAELHAELDRLRARTEADQAVLDAAEEYIAKRSIDHRRAAQAHSRLIGAVQRRIAARRAVQEATDG